MSKTKNLFESFQNNLKEDIESMKIDLDKEDKEFDKALNKFLNDTNSSKDESYNIKREHGWYYAKVKYKDNTDGYFYYHGINGKCDAKVHKKDISSDSSGMELNELIKKVNNNLNENTQTNLDESEKEVNDMTMEEMIEEITEIYEDSGASMEDVLTDLYKANCLLTGSIRDFLADLREYLES